MNGPGRTQKLRTVLLHPEFRPNYIIAAMAGVHPTRLSEYALGKRYIPPHHVQRLCEVLKCNPDDIIGDMEDDLSHLAR